MLRIIAATAMMLAALVAGTQQRPAIIGFMEGLPKVCPEAGQTIEIAAMWDWIRQDREIEIKVYEINESGLRTDHEHTMVIEYPPRSSLEVVRVGRTVRGIGEGVFRGLSTYPSLSKAGGGNGGWGYGGGGCLIL